MIELGITTLIAIFITTSGLLLAADTATVNRSDGAVRETQKIEQTGALSGAAMSGNYQWAGEVNANFEAVFRDAARELRLAGNVPVEQQVRRLGEALRREAETKGKPGIEDLLRYQDGKVLTVAVAGIEDGALKVQTVTIQVSSVGVSANFVPFTLTSESWAPPGCVLFLGSISAASALIANDVSLPGAVRDESSVRAMRRMSHDCRQRVTEAQAIRFFSGAVSASIASGSHFGIAPQTIGWPIDALSIRTNGSIEKARFNPKSDLVK